MEQMPLYVVGAFFRLGRKYEFTKLFKQADARLSHEFPSALEQWDQVSNCYSLIDWVWDTDPALT